MEKQLRKRNYTPIIELSDSDDDKVKQKQSSDDDDLYIAEESVPKKKKKTVKSGTKSGTENAKVKSEKTKNTVQRKAKDKDVAEKKKQQKKQAVKTENIVKQETNSKDTTLEMESDSKCKFDSKIELKYKIEQASVDCCEWTDADYISETNNVDKHIAQNVVKLLNEENTIPFIARYRRNMTGGMEPDQLRALKESFDQAKVIQQRAGTIIKAIDKLGKWTPELHAVIKSSKCLDDLEHIYSMYKTGSKRSLAERAKELGLEPVSKAVLQGHSLPSLTSLIDSKKEGLLTEQQVKDGIIHIIADIISKDKTLFDKIKVLQKMHTIEIHSTQCTSKDSSKESSKQAVKKETKMEKKKEVNEMKYETYFNFKGTERSIKPHQILAIYRGESQKILNVKIVVPNSLEEAYKNCCFQHFRQAARVSKLHSLLLEESIIYAYKKFIKPLIQRRVRGELKEKAESASIEVFATNVKQLLLTPPVRGKIVLGIDPGFYHGCKLAVVSEHGNVLETAVIYPHSKSETAFDESARTLINLVRKHKSNIIALGNATACRETESFLAKLIKSKVFDSVDVSYTIVDESGASIYSCSSEAKSEFPDMDPNLISAISIARRLQDPLAELVKVEPKHLGVGMYQHDLPEKKLMNTLNEVVSEAVSFVGVDVNTASHCLLKRVAGLNVSRASNIIDWRNKHGPFRNREQLLDVKGIGNKTYEQCAGFIRILPETAGTVLETKPKLKSKGSKNSLNLLDQTWIHPESYKVANEFLEYCKCDLENLGTPAFIERIKSFAREGCEALAKRFDTNETTMEVIVKGLTMRKDEDIRIKQSYPLFRKSLLSINDLKSGTLLTGVIRNVTHFGAFVDVGVETSGLIHTRWCKNTMLTIGQRVEVKVISVERERNRIGLELIRVL